MTDYNDVLKRIQSIYRSSTPEQQAILIRILEEIQENGDSKTYENIWLQDYKEIPVDINTFICDNEYLGKTNKNGKSVYPHWHQVLNDIFSDRTKYSEVVFTGATRIGKSSTAVTSTCYMLYMLMCLRNPQEFFNTKEVSKFSILFFNVTEKLAKGVAYREFNDTLHASPWFQSHGSFSNSTKDFYYIPEGGKIDIDYGSDASHSLGKQVFVGFCVKGDTEVVTTSGSHKIEDIVNQDVEVYQYDEVNDSIITSKPKDIIRTKYVQDTVKITLEDGTVFEATPDHKVMLSDGSYKMIKDLNESDDLKFIR